MQDTVARYEFRVFGDDFSDIEKTIQNNFRFMQSKESSEIYILSDKTLINNCKIRYDLLDIKQLIAHHDDLEQWIPKLKVSFPISRQVISYEIFKYLCIDIADLQYPHYYYTDFIEKIIKPHPDLKIINIRKFREAYAVNDCMIEIARVELNNKSLTTIGIESAYPPQIMHNRNLLGLNDYQNENYVVALKRLTDL